MFYSKSTGYFYDIEIHGDNIPCDAVEITSEHHAALLDGQSEGKRIVADENGHPVIADHEPPTLAEVIKQYEYALDAHMDAVAKQHRYDSRFTFALRAGFDGPYHSEGVEFAQWMDRCNLQTYQLLEDVTAGTKPAPESIDDFISMLPKFSIG